MLLALSVIVAGCQPVDQQAQQAGATAEAIQPGASAGVGEAVQTPVPAVKVPDVVGRRLTEARAALTAAGFDSVLTVDHSDRNRPVLEPDNWIVREQSPGAGVSVLLTSRITLRVTKPSDDRGSATTAGGMVPNVVCKDLQSAQDALQAAGFYNLGSTDGTGQGRQQLVDRNWVVTAQSSAVGSRPDPLTKITLTAVKFGEPTGASGCGS